MMKTFGAGFLFLLAYATVAALPLDENPLYGYLTKYGVPEAERIRRAEEAGLRDTRIVGGSPASLGEFPYQAGLIVAIVNNVNVGVCGATLVTPTRLLTAAHCWFDGINQGWLITVVLGSVTLFTGGTRVDTSSVILHPDWFPVLYRNDVAVIHLTSPVALSNIIGTASLPTGEELKENFVGNIAVASGFGVTTNAGSIMPNQYLSRVNLEVIDNSMCSWVFPGILQPTNLCTSGVGGVGTCRGDSGGPLVITRNNRRILIGITSFGSGFGCEIGFPAAYARVTSFIDFFNKHI